MPGGLQEDSIAIEMLFPGSGIKARAWGMDLFLSGQEPASQLLLGTRRGQHAWTATIGVKHLNSVVIAFFAYRELMEKERLHRRALYCRKILVLLDLVLWRRLNGSTWLRFPDGGQCGNDFGIAH